MDDEIDREQLVVAAWEAQRAAYAPYSGFSVGAALMTASGKVFRGCNVENISFGLTICAERSAATAAIQSGERGIIAIAIVADSSVPIVPCGACRQFLAEFNPTITIFSASRSSHSTWTLDELLPLPAQGILDREQ